MKSHLECQLGSVIERASIAQKAGYRSRELARLCQVSPRQLERYFREQFGRTPQAWLDELRLQAATDLMFQRGLVKGVAYELGFIHPSHFIRKFKRVYGCT